MHFLDDFLVERKEGEKSCEFLQYLLDLGLHISNSKLELNTSMCQFLGFRLDMKNKRFFPKDSLQDILSYYYIFQLFRFLLVCNNLTFFVLVLFQNFKL